MQNYIVQSHPRTSLPLLIGDANVEADMELAVECTDPEREFVKCGDNKVCPTQEAPTGPGCYCSGEGKYLYPPTNECLDLTDPRCSPPPARPPPVNLCKLLTNSMIASIGIPLGHPVHTLNVLNLCCLYGMYLILCSRCSALYRG